MSPDISKYPIVCMATVLRRVNKLNGHVIYDHDIRYRFALFFKLSNAESFQEYCKLRKVSTWETDHRSETDFHSQCYYVRF